MKNKKKFRLKFLIKFMILFRCVSVNQFVCKQSFSEIIHDPEDVSTNLIKSFSYPYTRIVLEAANNNFLLEELLFSNSFEIEKFTRSRFTDHIGLTVSGTITNFNFSQ